MLKCCFCSYTAHPPVFQFLLQCGSHSMIAWQSFWKIELCSTPQTESTFSIFFNSSTSTALIFAVLNYHYLSYYHSKTSFCIFWSVWTQSNCHSPFSHKKHANSQFGSQTQQIRLTVRTHLHSDWSDQLEMQ